MHRLLYLLQHSGNPSETFIRREITALKQKGWIVTVRSLSNPAPEAALPFSCRRSAKIFRREAGVPTTLRLFADIARQTRGRPRAALGLLLRFHRLRAIIATTRQCDLLHVHFADLASDMAAVAAAAARRPLTLSVHARDIFVQPRSSLAARAARPRLVFSCTDAGVRRLREAGVPESRIVYAPHGLPLEEYPFDPSPRPPVICGVGRFVAKKGFDLLIAAIGELRQNGHDFSLRLIGDGPLLPALRAQSERLNDPGAVEFTGFLTPRETARHIRSCAVLVLPSRRTPDGDRDGLANVLIEAMALGTPVVTTRAGAAEEAITHALEGWLVDAETPGQIAAAVRQIFSDSARAAIMTRNARRKIESSFDLAKTIEIMSRRFSRLIGQPGEEPG